MLKKQNKTRVLRERANSRRAEDRKTFKMSVLAPREMGTIGVTLTCLMKSWANLSCSWIHFSSSARKKLKGERRRKSHYLERHPLSVMR